MTQVLHQSQHSPIYSADSLSTSAEGKINSSSDPVDLDDLDHDHSGCLDSKGEVDKLLTLFSSDAGSLRPCLGYLVSQVSLRRDGVFRIIEVPCGCWECKRCGPKLKLRWYERLEGAMMHAPYVEALTIDRGVWKSFRVALRRSGVLDYIKMTQADGNLLILATGEMGGEVVRVGRRKSFLIKALEAVPFSKQPISTSRSGWVKSNHRKRGDEEWKTMDTVRPEKLEECEEKLSTFYERGVTAGYGSVQSDGAPIRTLEFYVPPEMMKDGQFHYVLWALGIHIRRKGEKRRQRREERLREMMAASG